MTGTNGQGHYSSSRIERTKRQESPYVNLPVIGIGMTGLIYRINEDRVVKVAKIYPLENLSEPDRGNTEYTNEINRETLKHEISVYERLGKHRGIISCFELSEYGIERAFARQDNLESYIKK